MPSPGPGAGLLPARSSGGDAGLFAARQKGTAIRRGWCLEVRWCCGRHARPHRGPRAYPVRQCCPLSGLPHGLQFLRCGGHGGLDRGDLAEPALFLGLLEPVGEIGADLFQARHLSWVDPQEGASEGVFMRARGPVISAADAEGDFPELEMGEEFVPLGGGELTVFFAGPLSAAAGDERPVVSYDVFGVDGLWRRYVAAARRLVASGIPWSASRVRPDSGTWIGDQGPGVPAAGEAFGPPSGS